MGFIDFVKDAGGKLFGGEEKAAAEAKQAEQDRRAADRRRAAQMLELVEGLGLEVSDLTVRVEGDTAIVGGTATDQATREKVTLALGNTAGIARVDDRMDVAAPEPEAVLHTVQPGDSLSKIAKDHYGDAMKYPVIFEANRPMLKDPDKIYPGQVLRIPPLASDD